MGMAIRCMPFDHLMSGLRITHHTIPTPITEAMHRDTVECHHLEQSTILNLNTELPMLMPSQEMVTLDIMIDILHQLPTIIRIALILNIMKGVLGKDTTIQEITRAEDQSTLRDLFHKLHQGSLLFLIKVGTTTIRITNHLDRLLKVLMAGFHRLARTRAEGMAALNSLETSTPDWTEEAIGGHLHPSLGMATSRVSFFCLC